MDTEEKRDSLGKRLAKGIIIYPLSAPLSDIHFPMKMDVWGKWSQDLGETNARSGGAWNGVIKNLRKFFNLLLTMFVYNDRIYTEYIT